MASGLATLTWMATAVPRASVPGGVAAFGLCALFLVAGQRAVGLRGAASSIAVFGVPVVLLPFTMSRGTWGGQSWLAAVPLLAAFIGVCLRATRRMQNRFPHSDDLTRGRPMSAALAVACGIATGVTSIVAMWPDPWPEYRDLVAELRLPPRLRLVSEERTGALCTSECGPTMTSRYQTTAGVDEVDLCEVASTSVRAVTNQVVEFGPCDIQGRTRQGLQVRLRATDSELEVRVEPWR